MFQSAMNALNPVLSLRVQILDVLAAHRPEMTRQARMERMEELMRLVGLSVDRAKAFPHELSGGMRQRAMIAIALALDPEIIILDEPTTALDVVMQRQILAEIMGLRSRLGFSVIFITHDLSLLVEVADVIAVMYAGRTVEHAASDEIYRTPRHPYSYGLLNSFPLLHGPRQTLTGIVGFPPDMRAVPRGCPFHPRCGFVHEGCDRLLPPLRISSVPGDSPEHVVACSLYDGGAVPEQLGKARAQVAEGIDATEPVQATELPVLAVKGLQKFFPVHQGPRRAQSVRRVVRAVDGVSLELFAGKVTALVGESGSGKSTIGRVLSQLYKATGGTIFLNGRKVKIRRRSSHREYVRQVQIVLQDPFSSLNPLHTVGYHLARPLRIHRFAAQGERGRGRYREASRRRAPDPSRPVRLEVPPRALGWPAATHSRGAGSGSEADGDPGRRAGLDARRLDTPGCAEPAPRPCHRQEPRPFVHHPRHRLGPLLRRHHPRHVRGSAHRRRTV